MYISVTWWSIFAKAVDVYFRRFVFYCFPFATVMPSFARFLPLSSMDVVNLRLR